MQTDAMDLTESSALTRPPRQWPPEGNHAGARPGIPQYAGRKRRLDAGGWQTRDILVGRIRPVARSGICELGTEPPAGQADILAITALAGEYRAAAGALGSVVRGDQARCVVADQHGRLWAIELVLINSMGSVQAALQTQDSLRRTKATHVVLLGIAAGVPGKVELGDVIIPEQIYYYESSKIIGKKEFAGPQWRQTDARVRRAASVFGAMTTPTLPLIRVTTDAVIASGEKVVASEDFRERFSRAHRKIAAIDMESYGVACATDRRGARLTVIKGISDFADMSKNDDYNETAAEAAAQVFANLVRTGIFGFPFNDG